MNITHITATVHGWATVTYIDGTTEKLRGIKLDNAKMNFNSPADVVVESTGGRKIVDRKVDLSHYVTTKVDGRRILDCGDKVASMTRNMNLDAIYAAAAEALNVPVEELRQRYGHLNPGMQKMNLNNRMRSSI